MLQSRQPMHRAERRRRTLNWSPRNTSAHEPLSQLGLKTVDALGDSSTVGVTYGSSAWAMVSAAVMADVLAKLCMVSGSYSHPVLVPWLWTMEVRKLTR